MQLADTQEAGVVDPSSSPSVESRAEQPAAVALSDSAGAAELRQALQVTSHQLGELTSRLSLDIGDRPNYPRYGRREVHLLTAALVLREQRVPLDDTCAVVTAYRDFVQAGIGWLVLYPAGERWVAVAARALEAVASLLALRAAVTVLDLPSLLHRSDSSWLHLRSGAVPVHHPQPRP